MHFLMLNTELSSRRGSRQHDFVAADLRAVNRTRTPWVLVFGHRQMYAYNISRPANELGDLEPLLLQGKVDVAIWGHIHFTQATCPMAFGACVDRKDGAGYDAPIHAVVGNAGMPLDPISEPAAPWTNYAASEWGWAHIEVPNATHLRMDFRADVPIGEEAPVHHSIQLVRGFPRIGCHRACRLLARGHHIASS